MEYATIPPRKQRLILALLWIAFFTAYLDRTNVSIAGPMLMKSLAIGPDQFGYVLAAFTAGYALMQIPGGLLADRFGAKRMLVIALLLWSAFTGITGLAVSLGTMIAARFFFGIGEGIENGAHFKGLADTFSSRDRSAASGILHTGIALGPAVVAPVAALILNRAGWHALFFWFTIPGLAVALLVARFWPDGVISERIPAPQAATPFVRDRQSWYAFAAYLLFNVAFWGFLGWMPSYLSQERHIDLKNLGFIASIPYLCGFAGLLVVGFLASGPLYRTRSLAIAVCYFLSGAGLYVAFSAHTIALCIAGLSLAAFFLYGSFAPFWAVVLDRVGPNSRGAFSTFVNFGGQIGGFTAPIVVGKIVAVTHSFAGGFEFMSCAVVLASCVMLADQRFDERRTA